MKGLLVIKVNRIANNYTDTQNLKINRIERERSYYKYYYGISELNKEYKKVDIESGSITNRREVLGGYVFEVNNKIYFYSGDNCFPYKMHIVGAWYENQSDDDNPKGMVFITLDGIDQRSILLYGNIKEITCDEIPDGV